MSTVHEHGRCQVQACRTRIGGWHVQSLSSAEWPEADCGDGSVDDDVVMDEHFEGAKCMIIKPCAGDKGV